MTQNPKSNVCVFQGQPKNDYTWLSTTKNIIMHCVMEKTKLNQKNLSSDIYGLNGKLRNDERKKFAAKNHATFIWNPRANGLTVPCDLDEITSCSTMYTLEKNKLPVRDLEKQTESIVQHLTEAPNCTQTSAWTSHKPIGTYVRSVALKTPFYHTQKTAR